MYWPAQAAQGWVAVTPMAAPLGWAAAVAWLDGIRDGCGRNTTSVYDPAADAWTAGPSLLAPRMMMGMGTFVTGNLMNVLIIDETPVSYCTEFKYFSTNECSEK
jgi:hypothetical protein